MEENETPKPTSGEHLAQILGVRSDEGVLIAVLPDVIEEITTQEIPYLDSSGERCHIVLARMGAWGERAMDIVSMRDQPFKWWQVKEAASDRNLMPVRWQGPVSEIPQEYFDKNYVLAVRFYQHGPWFFPKEQPKLQTDTTPLEAVDGVAAE